MCFSSTRCDRRRFAACAPGQRRGVPHSTTRSRRSNRSPSAGREANPCPGFRSPGGRPRTPTRPTARTGRGGRGEFRACVPPVEGGATPAVYGRLARRLLPRVPAPPQLVQPLADDGLVAAVHRLVVAALLGEVLLVH